MRTVAGALVFWCALVASGQQGAVPGPAVSGVATVVAVVDETGLPVPAAQVTVLEPGQSALQLWTGYDGHCSFVPRQRSPYQIQAAKPGFYQIVQSDVEADAGSVKIVLTHEQIVQEQVDVTASVTGIDPEQTSDQVTMNTSEIVNIPYETSRDIRYLLPFNPGVVADASEQMHVAGSETWDDAGRDRRL